MVSDLRSGLRALVKSRGSTFAGLLALGLGIGANAAVYSCAYGMLQHPFPFRDAKRVVYIRETQHGNANDTTGVAPGNYFDWSQQVPQFSRLAAWEWYDGSLTGGGLPQQVSGARVDAGFFPLLGVKPVMGRTFAPDETQPGHERELLLSRGLWQRRFNASPGIVGQNVELDGQTYSIIGIMGGDAALPSGAEVWLPLTLDPALRERRDQHPWRAFGLLAPGVTLEAANQGLAAAYARLADLYPATNQGESARAMTLADWVNGPETRQYIYLLLFTVVFVLLIACANVANLQFARTLGRQHELAIRAALGAGRWRIVRQLLVESLLLAGCGALVGVACGGFSIHLIRAYMPAEIAVFIGGWDQVQLNGGVLAYTLAVALAAGVVAGLAPAFSAARPDINASLRDGARGAAGGRARHGLRAALVSGQVCAATVLLICASLMVRGFQRMAQKGAQYQPQSVLTMVVSLPQTDGYKPVAARSAFFEQVRQRLAALPGVQLAAIADTLPLSNNTDTEDISIEGRTADALHPLQADMQIVSDGYLQMLHVPMLQGRAFTVSDTAASPPVAIVSREMARRYWPQESPIGHRVKYGDLTTTTTTLNGRQYDNPWLTIVGVAEDVPYVAESPAPRPVLYRLEAQAPQGSAYLLLQGPGNVYRWAEAARTAVAAVDPDQPVFQVESLAELIHRSNLGISYVATMMLVAGILALALAAVGVYALMLYSVQERRREIGVRLALGATPAQIGGLIFRRGALLLGVGLAVGLPLAGLAAHPLASLTYGISTADPVSYGGTALLLSAAALLACWLPARQAGKVDPLVALREE